MPFWSRFWRWKDEKKVGNVDYTPPVVPPIANSTTLASTKQGSIDGLSPHLQAMTIDDKKEEYCERTDNRLASETSVVDSVTAVDASRERVYESQDDVSIAMYQPEQFLSPSGHVSVQMFTSASHLAISGGSFIGSQTVVHGANDETRLKIVYDTAAPNAILNAGGRADEVRCHPGTREEVLARSETWMDPPVGQQFNISRKGVFWLSGPAGAGKSAIMQTLAERRLASGLPVANFFFFRNDSTRSNARPLVATLLVQLFTLYPGLKPLIATALADNPLIFSQSLHDQFQHLVDIPIRALQAANPSLIQQPIILLIDGLDECSSAAKHEQQSLLRVLHGLVSRQDTPFLVFVASRPEPHLTMTFNEVGSSVDSIFLNEDYHPQHDIRLFVVAELAKIRKNHHLGPTLAHNWPTDDHIGKIVDKSSGQFVYAATVLRFISGSSASPAFSLNIVQGLRPVNQSSPFAELDAIYIYILSQVDDWKSAKDVLTAGLLADDVLPLYPFIRPLGYEKADIPSLISNLTAIVKLEDSEQLVFYHASLTDFLRDKDRSGDYYINTKEFCDGWALDFVRCIRDNDSLLACGSIIEKVSGPRLSITKALLAIPIVESRFARGRCEFPLAFMRWALRTYCGEDDLLYKQLVRLWIVWFCEHGVIFEEINAKGHFFGPLQYIKAQLEPGVWDEILRSSIAQAK